MRTRVKTRSSRFDQDGLSFYGSLLFGMAMIGLFGLLFTIPIIAGNHAADVESAADRHQTQTNR